MAIEFEQTPGVAALQSSGSETVSRDGRVKREIEFQLQRSPYREVRNVVCSFANGLAVLDGEVTSFHLKQIAQTLLQNIDGVSQISNLLKVSSPHSIRRAR